MADITATTVKDLRDKSGAGMMSCKKALQETGGDMDAAIEYLRKQGQATAEKRAGRAAKEGKIATRIDDQAAVMIELNCETDFVARNDDFQSLLETLADAAIQAKPADLDAFKTTASPLTDNQSVQDLITEKIGVIGENVSIRRYVLLNKSADQAAYSYIHMGGKIGVLALLDVAAGKQTDEAVTALGKDICMHVAAADPMALKPEDIAAEKIESEKKIYREMAQQEGKPDKILERIVEGRLKKFYAENCLLEQAFVKDPDKKVGQVVSEAARAAGTDIAVQTFVRYQLGMDG